MSGSLKRDDAAMLRFIAARWEVLHGDNGDGFPARLYRLAEIFDFDKRLASAPNAAAPAPGETRHE